MRELDRAEINRNCATFACKKIEGSIQKKQYAAVFMDVQGAFDSTTFATI